MTTTTQSQTLNSRTDFFFLHVHHSTFTTKKNEHRTFSVQLYHIHKESAATCCTILFICSLVLRHISA